MNLYEQIPLSWRKILDEELSKAYLEELEKFLQQELRLHQVYPPLDQIFRALELTPYEKVNVVIVGQDPYHGLGQANGLAFSVGPKVPPPPSLVNIFKELQDDLGITLPAHGNLESWARQGVLLLNTSLTVRAGIPASHRGKGWELFSDAIISAVSERPDPVVFVLWGAHAHKKELLIGPHHFILRSAHPSPYSAERGFFGSRPFSRINQALRQVGKQEIDWRL